MFKVKEIFKSVRCTNRCNVDGLVWGWIGQR